MFFIFPTYLELRCLKTAADQEIQIGEGGSIDTFSSLSLLTLLLHPSKKLKIQLGLNSCASSSNGSWRSAVANWSSIALKTICNSDLPLPLQPDKNAGPKEAVARSPPWISHWLEIISTKTLHWNCTFPASTVSCIFVSTMTFRTYLLTYSLTHSLTHST